MESGTMIPEEHWGDVLYYKRLKYCPLLMRWLYVYLRVYKHATLATRGSELTRVSEVEHSPPPIISDQWSHREQ